MTTSTMRSKQAPYITTGTHILFRFFKANELGTYSLAGAQAKLSATELSGRGVVRNLWSDDPQGKTNVRVNVELENGTFLEVPVGGIIAVSVKQEDGTFLDVAVAGIERVDP